LTPKVFVVTGPSGVGKGTLISSLLDRTDRLELSISATTRKPRPGEVNGVHYYFLSDDEFDRYIAESEFLEHAAYVDKRYGTLRSEVSKRTDEGMSVVLEIEVQGARQIRETMPEAVQIFIAPPSLEALKERLLMRGTDSETQVQRRLETAESELAAQNEFSYVIVNDDLKQAEDMLFKVVADKTQT